MDHQKLDLLFSLNDSEKEALLVKYFKVKPCVCTCRGFVAYLYENGTVNIFGHVAITERFQRPEEKEKWNGIRKLVCGENHIVGLKADGTVVAFGDNSYGQCDVSTYQDIMDIAAAYHYSFLVGKDGCFTAGEFLLPSDPPKTLPDRFQKNSVKEQNHTQVPTNPTPKDSLPPKEEYPENGSVLEEKLSFTEDMQFQYFVKESHVYLYKYVGKLTTVEIPSKIGDKSVTYLCSYAFFNSNIEVVKIPDSVLAIGKLCFAGCKQLQKVYLSESLERIGNSTFKDCSKLDYIPFPSSLKHIGKKAFAHCENLSDVKLSVGLERIEALAFVGCKKISQFRDTPANPFFSVVNGVIFNNEMTKLIAYPSGRPDQLYWIPKNVTQIQEGAFADNQNLKEISVDPDNPSFFSMDGVLFNRKTNCLEAYASGRTTPNYQVPYGMLEIGAYAFHSCSHLESITLPQSIEVLQDGTFEDCSNLLNIVLSNNITWIGASAFQGCRRLRNMILPPKLTAINDYTFNACENLQRITIPSAVTSIGEAAFSWCENLKEINLPEGLKEIGPAAFSWCKKLENIEIPEGVTRIQDETFEFCENLTAVSFGGQLQSIGDKAFMWCKNLAFIPLLPASVMIIGTKAFFSCGNLAILSLPDDISMIHKDAFTRCSKLVLRCRQGTSAQSVCSTMGLHYELINT